MINTNNETNIPTKKHSKFLSLILRHRPEIVGITLDTQGWVAVDRLLLALQRSDCPMNRAMLDQIVATNDKQRFSYDITGQKIRANQGHSINIDLALTPVVPPNILYHGTTATVVDAILTQGVTKQSRQYVHLSHDIATATKVGSRHGKPVVFSVQADQMSIDGYQFYRVVNGVWLTEYVPSCYLQLLTK